LPEAQVKAALSTIKAGAYMAPLLAKVQSTIAAERVALAAALKAEEDEAKRAEIQAELEVKTTAEAKAAAAEHEAAKISAVYDIRCDSVFSAVDQSNCFRTFMMAKGVRPHIKLSEQFDLANKILLVAKRQRSEDQKHKDAEHALKYPDKPPRKRSDKLVTVANITTALKEHLARIVLVRKIKEDIATKGDRNKLAGKLWKAVVKGANSTIKNSTELREVLSGGVEINATYAATVEDDLKLMAQRLQRELDLLNFSFNFGSETIEGVYETGQPVEGLPIDSQY